MYLLLANAYIQRQKPPPNTISPGNPIKAKSFIVNSKNGIDIINEIIAIVIKNGLLYFFIL